MNSTGNSRDADNGMNLSMELNRGRLNSTGNSMTLPNAVARNESVIADDPVSVPAGDELSTDEMDVNLLFGGEDEGNDHVTDTVSGVNTEANDTSDAYDRSR